MEQQLQRGISKMDRLDIIMQSINALIPDAKYIIRGDFSGLEWLDERTVPTESEVQTKYDELVAAEPLNQVREVRDAKLAQSDWTQGADSPLTDSKKTAMKTYRQALRDITDSATSLDDVTWPEKP